MWSRYQYVAVMRPDGGAKPSPLMQAAAPFAAASASVATLPAAAAVAIAAYPISIEYFYFLRLFISSAHPPCTYSTPDAGVVPARGRRLPGRVDGVAVRGQAVQGGAGGAVHRHRWGNRGGRPPQRLGGTVAVAREVPAELTFDPRSRWMRRCRHPHDLIPYVLVPTIQYTRTYSTMPCPVP